MTGFCIKQTTNIETVHKLSSDLEKPAYSVYMVQSKVRAEASPRSSHMGGRPA